MLRRGVCLKQGGQPFHGQCEYVIVGFDLLRARIGFQPNTFDLTAGEGNLDRFRAELIANTVAGEKIEPGI